MDIERIKQIGIRAAYRGGEILKRHFGHLQTVNKKGVISDASKFRVLGQWQNKLAAIKGDGRR